MRGAAVLAGALLIPALTLFGACSSRVVAKLAPEGSAELSVTASLPPALAAKLRALAGLPSGSPLFDAKTVRKSLLARPGLTLHSLANPDSDSLAFSVGIEDLGTVLAAPDIAGPGLIVLQGSQGSRSLAIHLRRGQGSAITALAPGLDPELLEALSPPALDSGDFTREEYRRVLGSILGTKVLPDLDAARIDCSIYLPGKVISTSGGKLEGSIWKISIPLLDLLVLENDLEFQAGWIQ